MSRERLMRIVTAIGGAALAYMGWKSGNSESLAAGASMVGAALPWPQDRERAKIIGSFVEMLSKEPHESEDVKAAVERAKAVNALPVAKVIKPRKEKP